LERVSVEQDGRQLLRASARADRRLRIDQLDLDHPHWRKEIEAISLNATYKPTSSDEDRLQIRSRLESLVPKLAFHSEGFAPGAIARDAEEQAPTESADATGAAIAEFPRAIEAIYAEPTKDGTKLHHLRITPDGDFVDRWPDGFFTERGAELFT